MRLSNEILAFFGYDDQVQTFILKQGETREVPMDLTTASGSAIDVTDYTFDFQLIERYVEGFSDIKSVVSLPGISEKTGANVINLASNVTIANVSLGNLIVYLPETLTSNTVPISLPTVYTGFIEINDGGAPPQINKLQMLVIVTNDGV